VVKRQQLELCRADPGSALLDVRGDPVQDPLVGDVDIQTDSYDQLVREEFATDLSVGNILYPQ
jgi:hypothetical protein